MTDGFLSTTAYFPPLSWMLRAASTGAWWWEANENYQKGGWRNRCRIMTANGPHTLTVPLQGGKHQQMPIREVRISHHTDWWRVHEQTLRSAYGRAPYFEYYAAELFALAARPHELLYDYNLTVSEHCLTLLGLDVAVRPTFEFSGAGAGAVEVGDTPAYPQLFEDRYGFVGGLSVLDALFCLGPAVGNLVVTSRANSPD